MRILALCAAVGASAAIASAALGPANAGSYSMDFGSGLALNEAPLAQLPLVQPLPCTMGDNGAGASVNIHNTTGTVIEPGSEIHWQVENGPSGNVVIGLLALYAGQTLNVGTAPVVATCSAWVAN